MEAVEQFHVHDTAFRKQYYYLAQLETDPNFMLDKIPLKRNERRQLKAKDKAERELVREEGLPPPKKKARFLSSLFSWHASIHLACDLDFQLSSCCDGTPFWFHNHHY